jgi:hypothetical protein
MCINSFPESIKLRGYHPTTSQSATPYPPEGVPPPPFRDKNVVGGGTPNPPVLKSRIRYYLSEPTRALHLIELPVRVLKQNVLKIVICNSPRNVTLDQEL